MERRGAFPAVRDRGPAVLQITRDSIGVEAVPALSADFIGAALECVRRRALHRLVPGAAEVRAGQPSHCPGPR